MAEWLRKNLSQLPAGEPRGQKTPLCLVTQLSTTLETPHGYTLHRHWQLRIHPALPSAPLLQADSAFLQEGAGQGMNFQTFSKRERAKVEVRLPYLEDLEDRFSLPLTHWLMR